MSMGHSAWANKVREDEISVEYEYGVRNLNVPNLRNEKGTSDGRILLKKSAIPNPDVQVGKRRSQFGRTTTERKKIPKEPDFDSMLAAEDVKVLDRSLPWRLREDGIDAFAVVLLRKIFEETQTTGAFPQRVSYYA